MSTRWVLASLLIYHSRRFKLAVHDYLPIFFKVDVSTKLVLAIDTGKYSETQTIVYAIFEKIEILSILFLGDYSSFKKKGESRNFTDGTKLECKLRERSSLARYFIQIIESVEWPYMMQHLSYWFLQRVEFFKMMMQAVLQILAKKNLKCKFSCSTPRLIYFIDVKCILFLSKSLADSGGGGRSK